MKRQNIEKACRKVRNRIREKYPSLKGKWEIQSGMPPHIQKSGFCPHDRKQNDWPGLLIKWSDAVHSINPGENMTCCCYRNGILKEFGLYLRKDGVAGYKTENDPKVIWMDSEQNDEKSSVVKIKI